MHAHKLAAQDLFCKWGCKQGSFCQTQLEEFRDNPAREIVSNCMNCGTTMLRMSPVADNKKVLNALSAVSRDAAQKVQNKGNLVP